MSTQIRHMRVTVEGKAYDVQVELLDEPSGRPVNVVPPPVRSAPQPRPEPAVARPVAPPPPAPAPTPIITGGRPVPSPLSGMVVAIDVTVGQKVEHGDLLVTLEAMKMKAPIAAPFAGTVAAIHARVGVAVEEGAPIVVIG